ncbi:MAG: FMN-binding negative transcriptional regulator [Steroidobacter sp.]
MSPTKNIYDARSDADLLRLVRQQPLAWVVSGAGVDFRATLLPVMAEADAEGRIARLTGHFARSNDQQRLLARDPRATILVLGTNGYISPSWFADKSQAPTWNYASAQFVVDFQFFDTPEPIEAHLRQLVDTMEAQAPRAPGAIPWDIDQMGQRYFLRSRAIIGFSAAIREVRPKFKLGQDERDDVFSDLMAGLKHGPTEDLQAWMRDFNPHRS